MSIKKLENPVEINANNASKEEILQIEKSWLTNRINAERGAATREARREIFAQLGFEDANSAAAFVETARAAQEAQKSEAEKTAERLAALETELAARDTALKAAETLQIRTTVLTGLGATGENLKDSLKLLEAPDDADLETLKAAAEALKIRHPAMFNIIAAPANNPDPKIPVRPSHSESYGATGLEAAKNRFNLKDKTK